MASSAVVKRRIDPDIFKKYIKSRGLSIRQLGSLCQTNEKTIRRMLQDKEVTLNIALDLCAYLQCDFNKLFGYDESPEWKKSVRDILKRVR
jgi:DNA-binding Xre family transcriptional regulator